MQKNREGIIVKRYKILICVIVVTLLTLYITKYYNYYKRKEEVKKDKIEEIKKDRYFKCKIERIGFIDSEQLKYYMKNDTDGYNIIICLNASNVCGNIVYDKLDEKLEINIKYIDESQIKMRYALYNKSCKEKSDEMISIKDFYNIIGDSKLGEFDLEKVKSTLDKNSFDKIKKYSDWQNNDHKDKNIDDYNLTAEHMWGKVADVSSVNRNDYDYDEFTEEDWALIVEHYETGEGSIQYNTATSLEGDIKALEHAKK